MTQQQKVSVIALGVFAIAAITLGLLHVNQGLVGAVAWKPKEKTIEQTQKEKDDTILDLQSKDTDGDGLNDYEELNVFTTSPYLTDTDGDNLDDAKEIQSGTDPNCPEGKKCGGEELAGDIVEISPEKRTIGNVESLPVPFSEELEQILSGREVTPDVVRRLLLKTGIDERTLSTITDEMLMEAYYGSIRQTGALDLENTGGPASEDSENDSIQQE